MYDAVTQKVLDHLNEHSFNYQVTQQDARTTVQAVMGGGSVTFPTYIAIEPEKGMIQCHSRLPVQAQPHQLALVAEALHRANWGLRLGNFEVDYRDGEIRYHTAIVMEDSELSDAMIHHLLGANWAMMHRYAPALMQVLFGGVSPRQAIAEAEGETPDPGELLPDPPQAAEPDALQSQQMQELLDRLMAEDPAKKEDDSQDPDGRTDRDAA